MSFPGILLRNWRLKIAALALAVLLWVTMRLSDDRFSRLDIPSVAVRVEQVHRDWFLRQPPLPSTVQMTVSGPLGDLFRVAMSQPVIVIRVDSVLKEDSVVTLIPDWVDNVDRSSVTIENFVPSSVRLLFERNKEEEIPVSIRLTGSLPDSLAMVRAPRANLLFTRVRGAASVVDRLETVFMEPFDLGLLTGPGRFDVLLDTSGLGDLAVNPTTATLTVDVATKRSRVLGSVPVAFPGAEDFVLEPAFLNVTLRGAQEVLDALDTTAVRVSVSADMAALRQEVEETGAVRVPVAVSGLSQWIEGTADSDSVTVRRVGSP